MTGGLMGGQMKELRMQMSAGIRFCRTALGLALLVAGCGGREKAPPLGTDAEAEPETPPDAAPRPAVRMDAAAGVSADAGRADEGQPAADAGGGGDQGPDGGAPALTLEPSPCMFAAPAGRKVECGFVTVPEDRARPAGRIVRLFVGILKAAKAKDGLPPLLYADGGPGIAGTQSVSGSFAAPGGGDFVALTMERDLIFFDARGTGASTPVLSCPPAARADAPADEETKACWEKLAMAKVDLGNFDTLAVADDIDDIRRALGRAQLDLLGVSYGTRVVLEVLRRHPAGVRAAIVDSVLTPEIDLLAETEPAVYRALSLALDGCAADATCRAHYPSLRSALDQALRQLEAKPATLTLAGGQKRTLDADTFVHFVTERLMDPDGVAGIPELIFQVREKKYTLITRDIQQDEPPPGAPAEVNYDGVYNTVICADEAPFTTAEKITAAAQAVPASLRPYFVEGRLAMCAGWKVPPAPATANQALTGEVPTPTLFLSGEIDPVTPPSWAQAAARALAHGYFVQLPGLSHGTMGHPCARSIIQSFLAHPETAPAAACAPTLPHVKFRMDR
jgi:pimeloyl-ACP methyl ester carboxylesterase